VSSAHHGPNWYHARRAALKRAAYRCELPECGKSSRLEVHHVTPQHAGGTNEPENLRVLCRKHHVREHATPATPEGAAWGALVQELAT